VSVRESFNKLCSIVLSFKIYLVVIIILILYYK
jgi:hypothetical protein